MLQTFTDIHCHIIPGVDDGPSTLEDSLVLANSLIEHGFTRAIATPHYVEDYSLLRHRPTLVMDNPERALKGEPVSLNPRKPKLSLKREVKKFLKS